MFVTLILYLLIVVPVYSCSSSNLKKNQIFKLICIFKWSYKVIPAVTTYESSYVL